MDKYRFLVTLVDTGQDADVGSYRDIDEANQVLLKLSESSGISDDAVRMVIEDTYTRTHGNYEIERFTVDEWKATGLAKYKAILGAIG